MGALDDAVALMTRYHVSASACPALTVACLASATIAASWTEAPDLVQRLLEAGADPTVVRDDDDTGVLHHVIMACESEDRHGKHAFNNRHITAAGIAAFTSCLGMLVEAGADPWLRVDDMESPVRMLTARAVAVANADVAPRWCSALDAVVRGSAWRRRRAAIVP